MRAALVFLVGGDGQTDGDLDRGSWDEQPDPDLGWTANGVGEAALFEDGLGGLALLFTGGLSEAGGDAIGYAEGSHPLPPRGE